MPSEPMPGSLSWVGIIDPEEPVVGMARCDPETFQCHVYTGEAWVLISNGDVGYQEPPLVTGQTLEEEFFSRNA